MTVKAHIGFRSVMTRAALLAIALALTTVPSFARPAPGGDSAGLPLRRGTYVETSGELGGADSSDQVWFGGGYVIQAPHAQCRLVSVTKHGKADYVVVERCLANGDATMPFRLVNHIHVVSHREFQMVNREGRFQFHWRRG
jgi:hypothetical protein